MSENAEQSCSYCHEIIRQLQQKLVCHECLNTFHRTCIIDISQNKFFKMRKDGSINLWQCSACKDRSVSKGKVPVIMGTQTKSPVSTVAVNMGTTTESPVSTVAVSMGTTTKSPVSTVAVSMGTTTESPVSTVAVSMGTTTKSPVSTVAVSMGTTTESPVSTVAVSMGTTTKSPVSTVAVSMGTTTKSPVSTVAVSMITTTESPVSTVAVSMGTTTKSPVSTVAVSMGTTTKSPVSTVAVSIGTTTKSPVSTVAVSMGTTTKSPVSTVAVSMGTTTKLPVSTVAVTMGTKTLSRVSTVTSLAVNGPERSNPFNTITPPSSAEMIPTMQACAESSAYVLVTDTPSPNPIASVSSSRKRLPAVTSSTLLVSSPEMLRGSEVSSPAILSLITQQTVTSSSTTDLCSKTSPHIQKTPAATSASAKNGSDIKYQCCIDHRPLSTIHSTTQNSCNGRQFTNLPLYEEFVNVLEPTKIRLNKVHSFFVETMKTTHLKGWKDNLQQHMTDLREGKIKVLLRMCRNQKGPQEDCFPAVSIRVNGAFVKLMSQRDLDKKTAKHEPVDITIAVCRMNNFILLNIDKSSDAVDIDSLISIVAVRPKPTEAIMKELNIHHPDHTRDLVKKHLGSHEDDICTTSLRASLYCPIGKMRLTIPCRGRECSHIQCVDATTVLGMMKLRPKLKCPVCDRPAHFEELYIDGLFKEILETVDEKVEEVTFSKDGSWSCKKEKEDCIEIDNDTLNQSVADMSIIDLTETDTEATPIKKKPLTDNTALLNKASAMFNKASTMFTISNTTNICTSNTSKSCDEMRRVKVRPRPPLHKKSYPYQRNANQQRGHVTHDRVHWNDDYIDSHMITRNDRNVYLGSSSMRDTRSYGYHYPQGCSRDDYYSYDPQSLSRGFTLSLPGFSFPR
ncbi:uncharacterized protein LOC127880144 [Dreissena polymorpha]|nr:uncharacterized protein LOC127880144 [Dreissena polymorpha]XP_052283341.1 uncharacterized protein LOC127880144 [Dreissena polymorpha]